MGSLFDLKVERATCRACSVTDATGIRLFESALNTITDSNSANVGFSDADQKRLGTTREQHEAAYKYLH